MSINNGRWGGRGVAGALLLMPDRSRAGGSLLTAQEKKRGQGAACSLPRKRKEEKQLGRRRAAPPTLIKGMGPLERIASMRLAALHVVATIAQATRPHTPAPAMRAWQTPPAASAASPACGMRPRCCVAVRGCVRGCVDCFSDDLVLGGRFRSSCDG